MPTASRIGLRPLARQLLCLSAVLTAVTLAGHSTMAHATAMTSMTPAVQAGSSEKAPVQLADEITRRLRRMGINVIKTRISRPYDPAGELC